MCSKFYARYSLFYLSGCGALCRDGYGTYLDFWTSGSNYQMIFYLVFTNMAQSEKSRFSSCRVPLGSAYVLIQISGVRNR
jgi:hypothetical protein